MDTTSTPWRDVIRRWHLEKENPDAPTSDPVEPIVFWIENTTPPEYREAVRTGALAWNQAFESAGFSNAIIAMDAPDDPEWSPEDARYSVIRYLPLLAGWSLANEDARQRFLYDWRKLVSDLLIDSHYVTGSRFLDRYRLELILILPLVAGFFALLADFAAFSASLPSASVRSRGAVAVRPGKRGSGGADRGALR